MSSVMSPPSDFPVFHKFSCPELISTKLFYNPAKLNGVEFDQGTKFNKFVCHECLENEKIYQNNHINWISPTELFHKLNRMKNLNTNDADFLLIDTRDSSAYCSNHIVTSLSFNCNSKIMARRAIKLWSEIFSDFNQCPAPKRIKRSATLAGNTSDFFKKGVQDSLLPSLPSYCANCIERSLQFTVQHQYSYVIVYDEDGENFSENLQDAPTTALSPLHLFINHLLEHSNSVIFLKGGISAFSKIPKAIDLFLDSGSDIQNLHLDDFYFSESNQSKLLPTLSSEHRINCISVSSASTEHKLVESKTQNMCSKSNQSFNVVQSPLQFNLNATFPPKSMPMIKLVLAQMIVDTSEKEKMNDHSKADFKSQLGVGSDIFGALISQILPKLYLGNARDAQDKNLLEELGITHILNVTDSVPCVLENKIKYLRLPAVDNDSQNLKPLFDEAFEFIEEAMRNGGTVLVHCQAGVSRSVTIVIAYLLRRDRNLTLMEALEKVQEVRPIAGPNLSFMGQLQAYQKELKTRSLQGTLHLEREDSAHRCVASPLFSKGHSRNNSNGGLTRASSHDSLCGHVFLQRDSLNEDSPRTLISPISSGSGSSLEARTPDGN